MKLSTDPYKGTRDFFPKDMTLQNWMFDGMRQTVESYGYEEYNGPMLEPFELYAAKTGEEIVNKQLFWMMDQGERKLAVRPEMTPTLARMVASQVMELPKPIRWYSIPNLWRYERPQRGRLREHWQLNVDVLGGDPLYADFEILSVALDLMDSFGGREKIKIRVNHRSMMDEFFKKALQLESDLASKLVKALDAREKIGEEKFKVWVKELGVNDAQIQTLDQAIKSDFSFWMKNFEGEGSKHLEKLFSLLEKSGKMDAVVFDPMILRGMDYYTGMVFEIYDESPENNRAMFGGGRYDNLIGLFGKETLSGVGFGMGDVTFRNFLETHNLIPEMEPLPEIFVTFLADKFFPEVEKISGALRSEGYSVVTPLKVDSMKNQLKLADKVGAEFVLILGEEEIKENQVTVKNLKTGEQQTVDQGLLSELFSELL